MMKMKNYEVCLQALRINTIKLNKTEIKLEKAYSKILKRQYRLKKEKKNE